MKRIIAVLLLTGAFMAQSEPVEAQILSTKLRITVLDELGNVVPDAEVTLYATQNDYKNETNPVQPTAKTDRKGRALFKKLNADQFYVIVRKGDRDNSGGGEVISNLEKGKLNKANVVITEF